MRTAIPFTRRKAATPVPLKLAKALLSLALAALLGQAVAGDLLPMGGPSPIGGSVAGDSAALADLPLETLLQLAVVPSVSSRAQDAARPSEIYALHYVVSGVGQGVPAEQVRQEHLAMHGMRVREF